MEAVKEAVQFAHRRFRAHRGLADASSEEALSLRGLLDGDGAMAVMLDFVDPALPGRRLIDESRHHGRIKPGRRNAAHTT
jgi:hypothetical protein